MSQPDAPRRALVPTWDHRGGARVLLALALTLAWVALAPTSPASAHTELVASTPMQGAPVALSVDRVVLTFSGDLVAGASAVVVTGPSGEDVTVTSPGVAGAVVEVGVALRAVGRHVVLYRVAAQDGHVATGSYWFTAIDGGVPTADHSSGTRAGTQDAAATSEPSEGDPPSVAPDPAVTPDGPGVRSSGTPVVLWVVGFGGAGLLLVLLWRAAGRRGGAQTG